VVGQVKVTVNVFIFFSYLMYYYGRAAVRGIVQYTYLVDVWVFLRVGEHVESRVELVEHPDDFHGAFRVRVTGTIVAEADYAGKQQCHALEPFRRNRPLMPQLCRHADRQHGVQQSETIRGIAGYNAYRYIL